MKYELTKSLETGNKVIDEEHRELFQIVNWLLDACSGENAVKIVYPVAHFLLEHVMIHFQHEEELQIKVCYPWYQEHKAAHDEYREKLKGILGHISQDAPTMEDVINIHGAVAELVEHVKTNDRKMCDFLKRM